MAFPNANPFAFRLQRRLVALFLRKVHTRSCDKVFQSCIALHVLLLASILLSFSSFKLLNPSCVLFASANFSNGG